MADDQAFCSRHEFTCLQSSSCIPLKMRCDGKKDCESGEDELLCGKDIVVYLTWVVNIEIGNVESLSIKTAI